jgi:hypothetical protein
MIMNNTNNTHHTNNANNISDITDLFAENDVLDGRIELPPLPPGGAFDEDSCAVIRLYLAVWNDLSATQRMIISQHLQRCPSCARAQLLFGRATQMVQSMSASEPSARVDQTVFAAIASRRQMAVAPDRQASNVSPIALRSASAAPRKGKRSSRRGGFSLRMISVLAAIVVCVFALSLAVYSALAPSSQAFALPANLSWDNYVLLSKQTMMSNQGVPYSITSYDNMHEQTMNVETVMNGKLDVVVVADQQQALGLDMMHHVAQWDATSWMSDSSYFDLASLRQDLRDKKAVYTGKELFQGQEDYAIRYTDGHILLLDKDYMPVNVLEPSQAQGQGKPVYDTLQWLAPSKVAPSMWNMQVPQGFEMGKLPAHP